MVDKQYCGGILCLMWWDMLNDGGIFLRTEVDFVVFFLLDL